MATSLFYSETTSYGLQTVLTLTHEIEDYALTHYCCSFFVIYCCRCYYLSLFLSAGGCWVVFINNHFHRFNPICCTLKNIEQVLFVKNFDSVVPIPVSLWEILLLKMQVWEQASTESIHD